MTIFDDLFGFDNYDMELIDHMIQAYVPEAEWLTYAQSAELAYERSEDAAAEFLSSILDEGDIYGEGENGSDSGSAEVGEESEGSV